MYKNGLPKKILHYQPYIISSVKIDLGTGLLLYIKTFAGSGGRHLRTRSYLV